MMEREKELIAAAKRGGEPNVFDLAQWYAQAVLQACEDLGIELNAKDVDVLTRAAHDPASVKSASGWKDWRGFNVNLHYNNQSATLSLELAGLRKNTELSVFNGYAFQQYSVKLITNYTLGTYTQRSANAWIGLGDLAQTMAKLFERLEKALPEEICQAQPTAVGFESKLQEAALRTARITINGFIRDNYKHMRKNGSREWTWNDPACKLLATLPRTVGKHHQMVESDKIFNLDLDLDGVKLSRVR